MYVVVFVSGPRCGNAMISFQRREVELKFKESNPTLASPIQERASYLSIIPFKHPSFQHHRRGHDQQDPNYPRTPWLLHDGVIVPIGPLEPEELAV